MSIFRLFLCFIFVFAPICVFGGDIFDKLGEQAVHDALAGGIVIFVEKNGRIVHHGAYGTASRDSVFDLASLTKIYATTLALMKLTDDGLLDPADKISKFFPEYTENGKAEVTIEHLLRHTSGLPAWLPMYCTNLPLLEIPLENKAGASRKYSDIGFMILGRLIEKVSGVSLAEYVQKNIYKPMELTSTGFKPNNTENIMPTYFGGFEANMIKNKAACTPTEKRLLKGEVNDGNARLAFDGIAGHAGLFSNAADLARLTKLIADGGQGYIKKETIDRFLTKDEFGQAMGFALTADSLHADKVTPQTFGHLGFTGTSFVYVPEQKLTVIILTNRQINGLDEKGRYPYLKPLRRAVLRNALD